MPVCAFRFDRMTRAAVALALAASVPREASAQAFELTEPFQDRAWGAPTSTVFAPCRDLWSGGGSVCSTTMSFQASWGFACAVAPVGPGYIGGSLAGTPTFTFTDRVHRFGGYFTSNAGAGDVRVTAYSGSGAVLAQASDTYACGEWKWLGIESPDERIASVTVARSTGDGTYLQMSDLHTSACGSDDGDGDGVCDQQDVCPGADDAADVDSDDVPDACESPTHLVGYYDLVPDGPGSWEYSFSVHQDEPGTQDVGEWLLDDTSTLCPTAVPLGTLSMASPVPAPWTGLDLTVGAHVASTFAPTTSTLTLGSLGDHFEYAVVSTDLRPWGSDLRWGNAAGSPSATCQPWLPSDPDDDRVPSVTDNCDAVPNEDQADADLDGRGDGCDRCAGADDLADADVDGTPDDCDACPDDPLDDADADTVCGDLDRCEGFDDAADGDGDGVPDGCDPCAAPIDLDVDLDGVCDGSDVCLGASNVDADLDGVCDEDDLCAGDDASGDDDADGVCGDLDACAGFDDHEDGDGDGAADACDACPADALNDADADGVCGDLDACAGFDDAVDTDEDGAADGCDACPADPLDDDDADGVCGDLDACAGFDDREDADGDGVADGCDPCAGSSNVDADADGVCDEDDRCAGADASGDTDEDGTCDDRDPCDGASNTDEDGDGFCGDVDCSDEDGAVHEASDEVCNGVDDDCDGEIDPDCASDPSDPSDPGGAGGCRCDTNAAPSGPGLAGLTLALALVSRRRR